MYVRKLVLGMIFSGATVFAAPVAAQTYVVDTAAVALACSTSAEECLLAIEAAISAMRAAGLSPADMNAALGVIAGTAVSAAASLPPAELAALAAVMEIVAAASTDPVQLQALLQLATALESGETVDLVAMAASLSAS